MIQLNEVFKLSERKMALESAITLLFKKVGVKLSWQEPQSYSTKCETKSHVNVVLFLKVRKQHDLVDFNWEYLLIFLNLSSDLCSKWKYLVFTKIQQYIPSWNNFLHLTKTMIFIYFSLFFHSIQCQLQSPYYYVVLTLLMCVLVVKILILFQMTFLEMVSLVVNSDGNRVHLSRLTPIMQIN